MTVKQKSAVGHTAMGSLECLLNTDSFFFPYKDYRKDLMERKIYCKANSECGHRKSRNAEHREQE